MHVPKWEVHAFGRSAGLSGEVHAPCWGHLLVFWDGALSVLGLCSSVRMELSVLVVANMHARLCESMCMCVLIFVSF